MNKGPHIGTSVRSKEAPRHVTGRGRFVDDLVLPRMLHAFVAAQPVCPCPDRRSQRQRRPRSCQG